MFHGVNFFLVIALAFLIIVVFLLNKCFVQTYYELTSDSYLDFIKNYVIGIGPWKDTVVTIKNNYLDEVTDLVAKAHARGLQVHIFSLMHDV